MIAPMVTIDDFKKIELRVGEVVSAERVAGADKLLKLQVNLGGETRQIVSGIALSYPDPSVLVGKQIVVFANLEPREIRGEMSNGMLLAATGEEGLPVILTLERPVTPGSEVR